MSNAQTTVYEAVKARGYREGWTAGQFAARQVMKAVEELGELVEHVATSGEGIPTWVLLTLAAGRMAREAFDAEDCTETLVNWGSAFDEAADVVVTMLSLAGSLNEAQSGGFFADVVMTAESKATADIRRGVRTED